MNKFEIIHYDHNYEDLDKGFGMEKVWELFCHEYPDGSHNIENFDDYINKVNNHADIIVVRDDGKTIAFLAFYANNKEIDFSYITQLLVAKEYRRCKIGELLITEYEKISKSRGYVRLKLEVNKTNEGAISFYTSKGFREDDSNEIAQNETQKDANAKSIYMIKDII